MKLSKIVIKNFRSIKDATVELNPSCRVLVGINESGKSNILKALSLLDGARTISQADVRFALEDEPPIDDAYVRFVFVFDDDEINQIYEHLLGKVLCQNTGKMLINDGKQIISLRDFSRARSEGLYIVDVLKSTKVPGYWSLPKDKYAFESEWAKPSKAVPANFLIDVKGENQPLRNYLLVDKEDYSAIPEGYLESATVNDLVDIIGAKVTEIIQNNLPDCVYWTYNEVNILPPSIALATFAANPSSCIPLKHMFELASIDNIQQTIAAEQARTNGLRNLLARVAKQTTKHIKSVWQEYQSIEISLTENGANINASVTEGFNHFDFASRSDGFKRFVSFLIMISAKVKTNQLENTLLLIDEPEIGLHPSGARYLKDELIKIANKNHVVYSTHSIFMVDKECIERHLLVKKNNEVTIASKVTQSNFADEEVIYNALGYSIFDNLKETNILFEGWRDKKLFQVALEHSHKANKKLKNEFQKFGVAHLQGVKDVGRVYPILELANRNYIIISDCDDVAKAEQKKFSGTGKWKRWDELSNDAEIVTGEDFIKADHLTSVVSKVKGQHFQLSGLSISSLDFSGEGGKLHCIERWVGNAMNKEEKKAFLNQVKDESVISLTHADVEDHFYKFLNELLAQISQPISI